MADLSGLDRLWLGLLRAPLSWWARPHVLPDDLRRRYAQHDRPICYVLDMLGVADLVALEKVCARHGLAGAARRFEAAAAGALGALSGTPHRLLGRSHRSPHLRADASAGGRSSERPLARSRSHSGDRDVGAGARSRRLVVARAAVGELGARRTLPPLPLRRRERPQPVRAVRRSGFAARRSG